MVALVRGDPEPGHEDNHHNPEKEPEPVDGIVVPDRQVMDRPDHRNLRREKDDQHQSNGADGEEQFLPGIHESIKGRICSFRLISNF